MGTVELKKDITDRKLSGFLQQTSSTSTLSLAPCCELQFQFQREKWYANEDVISPYTKVNIEQKIISDISGD